MRFSLPSINCSAAFAPGWCGDFANCAFQSSCIFLPVRDFVSCKVSSNWRSQAPNWLQNFVLVLWTVSKIRTLHSVENWTLIIFSWILHKPLAVWWNFNFSSRPEFPRFCFKYIRTDEEQGKTHYHDGSLLPLNKTFLSFLSTLNGCRDASEINILVNI